MARISEFINGMFERILESAEWTSAGGDSPKINTLIQINQTENPDFESEIKKIVKQSDTGKKVTKFDKGNMGEINRLTSQQFGNIRQIATDPAGFIIQTFIRKFAKGVGIIAFALIIFESVKWVIGELLKPGRWLDLRFKRDIGKEIIAHRRREDQQKLKQGFSNIIITTKGGLRGGQNQITNTFDFVREGRDSFPSSIGQSNILLQASGMSLSKANGRRSGSGPGR
jgi:hypothetical protein